MSFILLISFIVLLRLGELVLSNKNEKWLLQQGAIEYGQKHYPFIVAMHCLFFVSLIIEYSMLQNHSFNFNILVLYLLTLIAKVWIIGSLGKFWNTKIFHISKAPLVKKGVYQYIKHPNYIVVVFEIVLIPLIFNLYYTSIIFSLLNALILTIRIKVENRVLKI